MALILVGFSSWASAGVGRIAYSRLTEGYWQIWICESSGSGAYQLTTGPSDKHEPAWFEDGTELLYCDSEGRLFRHDLGTGSFARLLEAMEPFSEPHVSRAGELVYQRVRHAPGYLVEVWAAQLDGTGSRGLSRAPIRCLQPSWSPDGQRVVAVQSEPQSERSSLVSIDPKTGVIAVLFGSRDRLSSPSWSPDGQSIAFARDMGGNNDIWILDLASRETRQLTADLSLDAAPVFSPDGSEILFVSLRSGSQQLWSIPTAGGRAVQVSNGTEPCREPAWWGRPTHTSRYIREVELSRRTLDLQEGECCEVLFDVTTDGPPVRLEVTDAAGTLVRRVSASKEDAEGVLSWDGRDDHGQDVAGLHLLRLVSDDPGGDVRWEPTASTGGELVTLSGTKLDDSARAVQFELDDLALVRARIGIGGDPLLATPMNWEVQGPGIVRVPVVDPAAPGWPSFWLSPERRAWVSAWRLPDNAVWVDGPGPLPRTAWSHPYRGTDRNLFLHALHSPDACRDVSVDAHVLPGSEGVVSALPVVEDRATIRVDAATSDDRVLLEGARFEVMLYVDGQFLMEDEDSALPYSFTLDVSRFPEGDHSFLAVVAGYQDHQGAAFAPFRIERAKR